MLNSKIIGSNVKAKVSAWILMGMVLMTIVPFNLLHDHKEEFNLEQSIQTNDHKSCDHKFHLAEEAELCLLCHFVFIPIYKQDSAFDREDIHSRSIKIQNTEYNSRYSYLSIYAIYNKGSPLA